MSLTDNTPGISTDQELQGFGYKQEFRREIKRFASFAVGFSFISITTGIFTTYGSVLNWGGPRGVWTWPLVVLGQLAVALVFASLASRIPLAGYSYQWASRLINPRVGWLIGWVSFTFLVVVTVSVDYAIASTVLPSLFRYTETPQNAWLFTALVILVQMLLILFSTRWTARVNNAAVATELIGIIGLIVLLLIVGAVRGLLHPEHVFSTGVVSPDGYFNPGGLFAAGPFVLSFLLGAYTIVGFEAAANLAEETHEPHRVVPFAMWSAVVLSGVVGFAFLVVLNLSSGDLKALSASSTPIADIIIQTLGGFVGDILLIFVAFSVFACGLVIFLTATRLTWAMSRDQRFPGARLFARVDGRTGTPVAATMLIGVLTEIVLAIFANQTNSLNNLFGAATLLPAIIYLFTVLLYAFRRGKLPPVQGFSLGVFEWPIIVFALIWLFFELSIFRDAQFATPWIYTLVMLGLGLIYFVFLLVRQPQSLEHPPEARMEVTLPTED
ncbi:MAG: amino acid permease [Ktedonobacteraceae bacterium]